MDILLFRLNVLAHIDGGVIDVADLTKAPSGDVGKVLLSYLDCIYIERLTDKFRCDRGSFHILFISITRYPKVISEGNADQNYYGDCDSFTCHA
jgi:hypothetical protein